MAKEKAEKNKFKYREKLSSAIIDIGLWYTEEVDNELLSLKTKTAKVKALEAKLSFRKEVLQQPIDDKSIFQFTVKAKRRSVPELTENVKKLVRIAFESPEQTELRDSNSSVPVFVGKRVSHIFCLGDEQVSYNGESHWYRARSFLLV